VIYMKYSKSIVILFVLLISHFINMLFAQDSTLVHSLDSRRIAWHNTGGLCIHDDCVFVASSRTGILVYDITDLAEPIEVARIMGDYKYLASYQNRYIFTQEMNSSTLDIYDVQQPSNPVLIQTLENDSFYQNRITEIFEYGNYLFIKTDRDLFQVFDVEDMGNVRYTGQTIRSNSGLIYGHYFYASDPVRVFDISNPENAHIVSQPDIFEEGETLYGCYNSVGIVHDSSPGAQEGRTYLIDLTDPVNPTLLSTHQFDTVGLIDQYLYMKDFSNWHLVDLSDPNLEVIGLGYHPYHFDRISGHSENYVYILWKNYIELYSKSTLPSLTEAGNLIENYESAGIDYSGEIIYTFGKQNNRYFSIDQGIIGDTTVFLERGVYDLVRLENTITVGDFEYFYFYDIEENGDLILHNSYPVPYLEKLGFDRQKNHLFHACFTGNGDSRLHWYAVDETNNLNRIETEVYVGLTREIKLKNDRAILLNGTNHYDYASLQTYETIAPEKFAMKAFSDVMLCSEAMAVYDNYIYIFGTENNTMYVFDMNDNGILIPENEIVMSEITRVSEAKCYGDFLLVITDQFESTEIGEDYILIFDLSNPVEPDLISSTLNREDYCNISMNGNYLITGNAYELKSFSHNLPIPSKEFSLEYPTNDLLLYRDSTSTVIFSWQESVPSESENVTYDFHLRLNHPIEGDVYYQHDTHDLETEVNILELVSIEDISEPIYGIWWVNAVTPDHTRPCASPSRFRIIPPSDVDEPDDEIKLPTDYVLQPAYPNPFNPSTRVTVALPELSTLHLKVYNHLGQEVRVLCNTVLEAGSHEYSFETEGLAAGIYFIQASTENGWQSVQKVVLLK